MITATVTNEVNMYQSISIYNQKAIFKFEKLSVVEALNNT